MGWRSWLDPEDAHGVSTFEVVSRKPGSTAWTPVDPPVSFEAAWRKASATETHELGREAGTTLYRLFADPPAVVTERQGVRSPETGVLNVVPPVSEERGEEIVLILAERSG